MVASGEIAAKTVSLTSTVKFRSLILIPSAVTSLEIDKYEQIDKHNGVQAAKPPSHRVYDPFEFRPARFKIP